MPATTPRHERSQVPHGHERRYRGDIDGLRAVSILLVVAFHAGLAGFSGGYVGVDVFFVLSGYLITGLLVAEHRRTGRVALAEFFARRVRRLLPLAGLVIVVTLVAGTWLLAPVARTELLRDGAASAFYMANWRFAGQATAYSDVEVTDGLLVHYWSLSIEEQFYVLWPLLVIGAGWLAARRGWRLPVVLGGALACVVGASFWASVALTAQLGPEAYYLTHARLWELGVGAGLALALPGLRALPRVVAEVGGGLGIAAILVAAVRYDHTTAFPGTAALLPVLGSALLVATATHRSTAVSRALELPALQWLGRRSYAWYLWHWPLIGLMLLSNAQRAEPWPTSAVVAVAVVASLVVAAVSHVVVENPIRHAAVLRSSPARNLALGGAISLVPVVFAVGFLQLGDTGDGPISVQAARAGGSGQAVAPTDVRPMSPKEASRDGVSLGDRSCNASGPENTEVAPGCVLGDPAGDVTIALIGDSHAQHWLPAFDAAARQRGWRLLHWTKGACIALDVPIWDERRERPYTPCADWRHAVTAELEAAGDVDLVVVGRSYRYARLTLGDDGAPLGEEHHDEVARRWAAGAQRTFTELLGFADRVVVLRDTPWAASVVPDCLSESSDDPARCAIPMDRAHPDELLHGAERRAAVPGVSFLDLTGVVCPADPCEMVTSEGLIKYRDGHHLTQTFATTLAPDVAARLDAILAGEGAG